MNTTTDYFWAVMWLILISFCSFTIGTLYGLEEGRRKMTVYFHQEAIKRDYAGYNVKTGQWEWKAQPTVILGSDKK